MLPRVGAFIAFGERKAASFIDFEISSPICSCQLAWKGLFYEKENFTHNKFDEPLGPKTDSRRRLDFHSLCLRSGAAGPATAVNQLAGFASLSSKGQRQWPVFGRPEWDAHNSGGRLSPLVVRQSQHKTSRCLFYEPRLLRHQCAVGRGVM